MWFEEIQIYLLNWGLPETLKVPLTYLAIVFLLFCLSLLTNFIAKRYIMSLLTLIVEKTRNKWDDVMLEQRVFNRLSHLAPAVVIYLLVEYFIPNPGLVVLVQRGVLVYMVVLGALFFDSLLTSVLVIYNTYEISKERPIKGYIQAVKTLVYLFSLIFMISTVIGKSPVVLIGTLGAFTAVLMLVFKDPILGFVAGIQLSGNKMVRKGDWIEMPQAGADGDVIDVTLSSVVVQNWDKSVTTVPIYHLISQPFVNWRHMFESGGRRIRRRINLDMGSIAFLNPEQITELRKVKVLETYLDEKLTEIQADRTTKEVDDEDNINARSLTNIGTYRAYIMAYLRAHPQIHHNEPGMTFLVHQLAPGESGLPIQVYVFTTDNRWAYFEAIQSDIFDHLLAVLPMFGLRIFQKPSSGDARIMADALENKDSTLG